MSKSIKSWYVVKNKAKYIGSKEPYCRSTWEHVFCRNCDEDPRIIKWAHEPLKIPYRNPLYPDKYSVYIPDFLLVYNTKAGKTRAELIEIKPAKQTHMNEAKSKRDKISLAVNSAKWAAASAYCKKHGMIFRVITERELFNNG